MTKEQLEQLQSLNSQFLDDCDRIVKILINYEYFTRRGDNISFADTYRIEDGNVVWEGDEYWSFGGHEQHSGYFPVEYLAMTNEEIETEATKLNNEYLDEKRKEEERRNKLKRDEDYKKFLKLKEEFES